MGSLDYIYGFNDNTSGCTQILIFKCLQKVNMNIESNACNIKKSFQKCEVLKKLNFTWTNIIQYRFHTFKCVTKYIVC